MLMKMNSSQLNGEIQAIASKSFVHRVLIAAALSNSPTVIKGRIVGLDVSATANCLSALGANIITSANEYYVSPIQKSGDISVLDCEESGSTLRFILPLACALGAECKIIGRGRLAQRPLSQLIKTLTDNGAIIEGESLPLTIKGRLISGDYVVPAYISSQYITGLLLALPIIEGDSRIILQGNTVSAPYIDITLSVLEQFGIEIKREQYGFYIKGGQTYRSNGKIAAEGDWSNSAFFIAGGVLSGNVTIKGLSQKSAQGDKAVVDVLQKMGAKITISGDLVIAKQSKLQSVTAEVSDIPDLVPVLAITAMYANGTTVFNGVDRLRDKESDRLSAIIEVISKLGGKTEYKDNALIVYGGYIGKEACLSSYNDHRMAMSAAIAALNYNGNISLEGSGCVSKSYPDFFIDYQKLGGKIDDKQS